MQERYPEFASNSDRIFNTMKSRSEKMPKTTLKALYGQSGAIRNHLVSPTTLREIGENNECCVVLSGALDKMIDPACSDYLARHIGANCKFWWY